ncbi:acyl-CoA dehydrogenase family protein [Afifella sp. IM 167]|uniref:acyl-CoA dehydrogenase family protein n=1 Tax=Afifella sp. IM 167 TaxID=2033586 RepID=UPI001CCC6E9E|nr:acyl-CoA dehydrogenase family protein [Afifella sp. IM 167]MBZ8133396.1 acyl-CoA dehydrogenase [Afifella sp. IM 167]
MLKEATRPEPFSRTERERQDAAPVDLDALACEIARHGARHDEDGSFPAEGFAALGRAGLLSGPLLSAARMEDLLFLVAAAGRGDLNVGRIFEGHVNALQLLELYGTGAQQRRYQAEASEGALLGVWNTDRPDDPLRLEAGVLAGAKNFASGVDGVSHAIVTVEIEGGRQMLIVPVAGRPVDRSWWKPLGMKASGSHIVDFTGYRPRADEFLGAPGDYVRQPWFSAGAIRFAAVHLGGAHAVAECARTHLSRTGRAANPYQAHRLGEMARLVEGGYGWLTRAGAAWREGCTGKTGEAGHERAVASANAMRGAIEELSMQVLALAEQAVGAAGMVKPHPLERLIRDLRTYLRQPNPDGALAALGEAYASGAFQPGRPLRPLTN